MVHIKVQKASENAKIPRQNPDSTYDIYSCVTTTIEPRDCITVDTGIIISVPMGSYARIESVELSVSHNIETSSFCSLGYHDNRFVSYGDRPKNVQAVLRNHGVLPYKLKAGDVIGRLVVYRLQRLEMKEYEDIQEQASQQIEYTTKLKSIPKRARTWFVRLWVDKPAWITETYLEDHLVEMIDEYRETDEYLTAADPKKLECNYVWKIIPKSTRLQVQSDFEEIQRQILEGTEDAEGADTLDTVPVVPLSTALPTPGAEIPPVVAIPVGVNNDVTVESATQDNIALPDEDSEDEAYYT
jgi:dUTPase